MNPVGQSQTGDKTLGYALPLLICFFLILPSTASAYNKLEGTFTAAKQGQAWLSFKKQTNPDRLMINAGESYPLAGENKTGGDWVHIKTGKGLRWVSKALGQIHLKQNSKQQGEFYTLALSWQPGFCVLNQQRQLPECQQPQTNWVLHGLWPSNRKAPHPTYCDGSHKQPACHYPKLGLDNSELLILESIMPSVQSCRQRYQWHKHGSCSGLTPAAYFDTATRYTQWFRASPVANTLLSYQGKKVSKAKVLTLFKDWGAGDSVTLHCKQKNNHDVLQEIRLYLNRELDHTPSIKQLIHTPLQQQCGDTFIIP